MHPNSPPFDGEDNDQVRALALAYRADSPEVTASEAALEARDAPEATHQAAMPDASLASVADDAPCVADDPLQAEATTETTLIDPEPPPLSDATARVEAWTQHIVAVGP